MDDNISLVQAFWAVFASVGSVSGVLNIIGYFARQALDAMRAVE